jgi:hypothetical protein
MAIFVEHTKTGHQYLLLGTGFGTYPVSQLPSFLGKFVSEAEPEETQVVALCDRAGKIFWLNSAEVTIIEIDGKTPSELLADCSPPPPPINPDEELKEEIGEDFGDDEDEDWI